jgi:hypothetical protein
MAGFGGFLTGTLPDFTFRAHISNVVRNIEQNGPVDSATTGP